MGSRQKFSEDFKDAIVRKVLNRGNQTMREFCKAVQALPLQSGRNSDFSVLFRRESDDKFAGIRFVGVFPPFSAEIEIIINRFTKRFFQFPD